MNPTLISGFEDIITHIKQQEQRIMALEQENKQLKQNNERMNSYLQSREIKYCEKCMKYFDDYELLQNDEGCYICEGCNDEYKKNKYDGDDWAWGYGYTCKDGEYRINMAGGGDHWEDYVINKNGCFIDNKNGKNKVKTFISCPNGNYIKVIHFGEDYELDEGETDMFDMVKECYEEEIMDYCNDVDDEDDGKELKSYSGVWKKTEGIWLGGWGN